MATTRTAQIVAGMKRAWNEFVRVGKARARHRKADQERISGELQLLMDEVIETHGIPMDSPLFWPTIAAVLKDRYTQSEQKKFRTSFDGWPDDQDPRLDF